MKAHVGTSGFSFKEWKGYFYPEKIKPAEMLPYYAERLTAVEINNTFYRLPRASVLEAWINAVPESFRFSVKVSRRVTHFRRLSEESMQETEYLLQTTAVMGEKLGVLFYQLPPMFAADPARLDRYLGAMPPDGPRRAFEFRNRSWFTEETYDVLRKHNAAMCIADSEDRLEVPVIATADWGYLRLRRPEYTADDLKQWADTINEFQWTESFVFFKHEEAGAGPALAGSFLEQLKTRQ